MRPRISYSPVTHLGTFLSLLLAAHDGVPTIWTILITPFQPAVLPLSHRPTSLCLLSDAGGNSAATFLGG